MKVECNAKINIGLHIVAKRSDGYHDLESIFYPLPIYDCLEINRSDHDSFEQNGLALECPPDKNLVLRARNLIATKYEIPPLEIKLHKRIPFGAGLGGGSSDAAFAIKLINEICALGMDASQMQELSALLGADCAFFIKNRPSFAYGKGDLFDNCKLSLSGLWFVLVKPDVSVSTAEAYRLVKPQTAGYDLRNLTTDNIYEWRNFVVNDFEKSIFALYPEIGEIKTMLYDMGAIYASMSGSGSSVFGLFKALPNNMQLSKFSKYQVFTGKMA